MDTSEQYIKMCEKAEEIQPYLGDNDGVGGTWVGGSILYHLAPMNQSHNRDGYYHITDEETIRRCKTCGHEEPYISKTTAIWLPRQDQLQEMVIEGCIYTLLGDLDSFISIGHYDEKGLFTSMEQLWLAFVMGEKFNKTWDGKEWRE